MANSNQPSLGLRISSIKNQFNLNNKDLGALAGISGQGIADIENGVTTNPKVSVFLNLSSKLDLNLNWLVAGQGSMLKADEPRIEIASSESIRKESFPANAIPLYDLDITAGNVGRLIEYNDNVPLVGWLHLEDTASAKGLIGVGAKGNSMAPYINSGDTMLIRRVENLSVVPLGEAYVIITSEQSVVKYLRSGTTPDTWTLRSHNREFFEDFEISKTEVKHLFMVVKVLKELTY